MIENPHFDATQGAVLRVYRTEGANFQDVLFRCCLLCEAWVTEDAMERHTLWHERLERVAMAANRASVMTTRIG